MRNGEAATTRGWEQKVASYALLLDDLGEVALESALRAIGQEPGRVYFPTPGEIRGVLERARLEMVANTADHAWKTIQEYMAKWGCPAKAQTSVIGGQLVCEEPPALDWNIAAAIAAAGGYDALYHTEIQHAHFARERFSEAIKRSTERQTRGILSPGAAKALLTDLTGKSDRAKRGTFPANDPKGDGCLLLKTRRPI